MQTVALVAAFAFVPVYVALRRGCRAVEFVVLLLLAPFDNNSFADFALTCIVAVAVDYDSLLSAWFQHSFSYTPVRFDRTSLKESRPAPHTTKAAWSWVAAASPAPI